MGVRFPSVQSNTFVGPLPASAVETVILVTPPLTISLDFSIVFLVWTAAITSGTGTTSFNFRLRRGTTVAGATVGVGQWVVLTTVGALQGFSGCYFDTPGPVAGQQYALTVIQAGATAAGVFSDGALLAFAL